MQDNLNVIRHVSKERNNVKLKEKTENVLTTSFSRRMIDYSRPNHTEISLRWQKIQNHRVTSSPFVFLSAKMVQRHTSRGRSFEKALAMFSPIDTSFDSRLRTHKHDRKITNASSFHSCQWPRKDPSCRRLAKRKASVRGATRHRT